MKNRLEQLNINGSYKKTFSWLFAVSALYVLPIILFHTCFNDDLGITLYGATGLNGDGRPLGQLMSDLLSGGGIAADIGPLPLLCTILILSYSLVVYAKENISFSEDHMLLSFVLLTILTNPLSMSTLFYRTGAFVMIAVLSIPFFLFSLNDGVKAWVLAIVALVSGIAIMSIYQAALGMCLVLVCINIVMLLVEGKNRIKNDIIRLIGLLLGVIVYMLFIMPQYIDPEGWRHEASKTLSGVSLETIKTFLLNIWNSTFYIIDYLNGLSIVSKIFLGLFVFTAWGYSLYLGYSVAKKNKKICILTILIVLVAPFVMLVASYLPLAILSSLNIKCRIFIALSGTLLYLGIFMLELSKKNKVIVAVVLSGYLLSQFSCMYSYANTVKNEAEYEKYLAYSIVHDIETINAENEYQAFSFSGAAPRSKKYELIRQKYSFYDEIVPRYFYNDTWIGAAWLLQYLQDDIRNEELSEDDRAIVENNEPILNNSTYSCYVNEDKIIIAFR